MSANLAISKVLKKVIFLSLVLSIMTIPRTIYASNGTDVKATNNETEKVSQYKLNDGSTLHAAPIIKYLYDENCLTSTEWNSGGWGDPNDVSYVVIDNKYDYYRLSIVKRSGRWTNNGYMRIVRASDNKVMWQVKIKKSSDWVYYDMPTSLLKEGDYRLVYGYGKPYKKHNWMMYYSRIIRVKKAK